MTNDMSNDFHASRQTTSRRLQTLAWSLAILACHLTRQADAAEVVTLTDTSGQTIADVALNEWSADRIVVDGPREHALDSLVGIAFGRQSSPLAGGDPLVILANGDRLVMRPVGVFEDVLTATWSKIAGRPPVKLPLETVAAIIFNLPAARDDRQRLYADLKTIPIKEDVVLLANGDRLQGDFERLDGTFVQLKSASGQLKLDRSRVLAIRMNPELVTASRSQGRRQVLSLRDGSRLTASQIEFSGRDLKCQAFSKLEFQVPIAECVSCKIYGTRVIPLTDREPIEFKFVPYLSNTWPLVKNANVLRGPLELRGAEYGTGLGVHSRSVVTYALQPTDREFRATVGIDDAANGAGSVRFAVELDGKRAWDSPEVNGRTPAIAIPPVKLTGAKSLTLIVDFGAEADIADYADWCEATILVDRD